MSTDPRIRIGCTVFVKNPLEQRVTGRVTTVVVAKFGKDHIVIDVGKSFFCPRYVIPVSAVEFLGEWGGWGGWGARGARGA